MMLLCFILTAVFGYDYFVAEFDGAVQGVVEFHLNPENSVNIKINLKGPEESHDHFFHIHESVILPGSNCNSAGSHVDSWSLDDPNYSCEPSNKQLCHVGDLSGKHGTLDLFEARTEVLIVDEYLFLSNITDRSLVIHGSKRGTTRFACSNIVGKYYPDYLSVGFSDIYHGAMIFRERSDGMLGIVHNINTHRDASVQHRYHVHENAISGDDLSCETAGGHFDPMNVETPFYNELGNEKCHQPDDVSTCFYGDLEGKYGALQLPSIRSVSDPQLRIPDIWGKSVVIHDSDGALERILCDTLNPQQFTEAIATFNGPVFGTIKFKTHHDGSLRMILDLRDVDNNPSPNHKIHIHVDNVIDESCASAGGHFDPLGVEVAGYSCNATDVSTCYVGDLSGKFGLIDLPTATSWRDSTTTINDIIGRSIVIHESNASPRYACATITPTSDLPDLAVGEFNGDVEGFFAIRTRSSGVTVMSSLDHESSTIFNDVRITEDDCASDLYNPFGAHINGQCDFGCPIGQLSRRNPGIFQSGLTAFDVDFDSRFEVPDLIDRSIAVGSAGCTTISDSLDVQYAEAMFDDIISGSMRFRQLDDSTLISFDLRYNSGSAVNWYIHKDSARDGFCHTMTSDGILNPFSTIFQNCDHNDLATCVIGDLTSKHGDLMLPKSSWMMDPTFSVNDMIGRSIIIADDNFNPISCATIMPKRFIPEVAAAEFREGLAIFRENTIVYALGETGAVDLYAGLDECPSSLSELPADADITLSRPAQQVERTGVPLADMLGKFMVLHNGGSQFECVEIEEVLENSEVLSVNAVAPFTGPVVGDIGFTIDTPDTFRLGVHLQHSDGSISQRHKWHIHTTPIPDGEACSAAAGHFDPTGVEVSGYSCDSNDPLRTCYWGDLSGRFEVKLPLPISAVFLDSDIPLSSMLGRSIVIHAENNAGPRYACATIFPIPQRKTTMMPTSRPTTKQPTRAPNTGVPSGSPTTFTATQSQEVNQINLSEGSSGSGSSSAVPIILAVVFVLILIPACYFAIRWYREKDLDDVFKSSYGLFDVFPSECPTWCQHVCPTATGDSPITVHQLSHTTSKINSCTHGGLNEFKVDALDWWCTDCKAAVPLGETMFGCRKCDVDICIKCHFFASSSKPMSPPPIMVPKRFSTTATDSSLPVREPRFSLTPIQTRSCGYLHASNASEANAAPAITEVTPTPPPLPASLPNVMKARFAQFESASESFKRPTPPGKRRAGKKKGGLPRPPKRSSAQAPRRDIALARKKIAKSESDASICQAPVLSEVTPPPPMPAGSLPPPVNISILLQ